MKIHLKTSDEPLVAGESLTANCGALVANAVARFWFDLAEAEDAASLNSIRICGRCYATRNNSGRYLSLMAETISSRGLSEESLKRRLVHRGP